MKYTLKALHRLESAIATTVTTLTARAKQNLSLTLDAYDQHPQTTLDVRKTQVGSDLSDAVSLT
jgi:hypothetical protein